MVHYFTHVQDTLPLREAMRQRQEMGCMNDALKRLVLQHLRESGSLEHTHRTLKRLEARIDDSIDRLERITNQTNWILRLCIEQLRI